MPTVYKILGQKASTANAASTIYTVPSATEAVISTIIIANRASTNATYRIAVKPNGASTTNDHYIAYDVTVGGNDSTTLTLGLTLDANDVLEGYASTNTLTYSAFGSEITA